MGSNNERENNVQMVNYYAENTVFVAVGKNFKESESALTWAVKKFGGKKRICILHVHQPHLLTFYGKLSISKFKQIAVKALHESHMQKLHKLVSQYVSFVSQMGVRADRMWIEMETVEDGIVKMIAEHGIKWLVMGAAADKNYTKEMADLKSKKAKYVYEQSLVSCHIWFICRGKLICTREGIKNYPGVDMSDAAESQVSNMATKEIEKIRLAGPGAEYPPISQPLDLSGVAEEVEHLRVEDRLVGGLSLDSDVSSEGSLSGSLASDVVTEEVASVRVNDLGANTLLLEAQVVATESQDSNMATKESEKIRLGCPGAEYPPISQPLDFSGVILPRVEDRLVGGLSLDSDISSEESESEYVESDAMTEEEVERVGAKDFGANLLLLESQVVAKESGPVRMDCMADDHRSPPRLTFRERGSILRACSVDFSSAMEKDTVLKSPNNSRTSNDCIDKEKEDHGYDSNLQLFKFRSSFKSLSSEGKMAGKAKLQTPRETYGRLEQATSDAENLKQLAFEESVKRWKAEDEAVDAKRKADAAKSKYIEMVKQRLAMEEALVKRNLECGRIKEEYEKCKKELPMVQNQCFGLKSQITESEIAAKELEEKIISAVELLISFKSQRDQLQLERDKAVLELKNLENLKQQRTAALSGLQFSTFSLVEIGEATCSFDPCKRIGDGRCGSIYRGILRHVDFAIRMLPNDGFLSQQMFEHWVEILSRIRHPNIVTLIGICPEARTIIYEYLKRGSLEDQLACRGETSLLQWQTRVRIAIELCSALIFLHTNNPPIIHGNLKPTKVLLDANFKSKLGDLGIFFLIPQNEITIKSQHCTSVYVDPDFLETGVVTRESDIYSFGMILLRLLTGRTSSGIVKDVKCALQKDKLEFILDFSAGDWPINQARTLARMALQCCDRKPSKRPDLASEIWSVLEPLRKSCDTQASCLQKKENRRPPPHFLCPIYQEVMTDPCTAEDGYTYEGEAIRGWLDSGHTTSPMTNLKLSTCDLIPNHALQYAIQEWLQGS
ncbi:U-box domain-containing protein 33-like isoform X2 [Chenopodium quinoa]|uniref:U-box domain-containing protein 33-like isoform X2 n=1 Tax=Chenopodium quinoa TaxID=63459 RepID=UPI000B780F0A|nr:U-box domain-containing protein 33-like isoform X2 [Chenopodium quinoa]